MTEALTPDVLAELDREMFEWEQEWEEESRSHKWVVDQHVTLLAWLYRQMNSPVLLEDQSHWPGVWPMDWADFNCPPSAPTGQFGVIS